MKKEYLTQSYRQWGYLFVIPFIICKIRNLSKNYGNLEMNNWEILHCWLKSLSLYWLVGLISESAESLQIFEWQVYFYKPTELFYYPSFPSLVTLPPDHKCGAKCIDQIRTQSMILNGSYLAIEPPMHQL